MLRVYVRSIKLSRYQRIHVIFLSSIIGTKIFIKEMTRVEFTVSRFHFTLGFILLQIVSAKFPEIFYDIT